MADETTSQDRGYAASAWLAELIKDLDHRGLLVVGEVRAAVASSIELFREQGPGDPDHWHVDLFDLYEDLHGRPPEPRHE